MKRSIFQAKKGLVLQAPNLLLKAVEYKCIKKPVYRAGLLHAVPKFLRHLQVAVPPAILVKLNLQQHILGAVAHIGNMNGRRSIHTLSSS